jgi:hypothetical protein
MILTQIVCFIRQFHDLRGQDWKCACLSIKKKIEMASELTKVQHKTVDDLLINHVAHDL